MGSIKHGHCSHALEEDAPKALEHDSISKWAIWARKEWQTPCYLQNIGTEFNVRIRSFLRRHWMGGGGRLILNTLLVIMNSALLRHFLITHRRHHHHSRRHCHPPISIADCCVFPLLSRHCRCSSCSHLPSMLRHPIHDCPLPPLGVVIPPTTSTLSYPHFLGKPTIIIAIAAIIFLPPIPHVFDCCVCFPLMHCLPDAPPSLLFAGATAVSSANVPLVIVDQ